MEKSSNIEYKDGILEYKFPGPDKKLINFFGRSLLDDLELLLESDIVVELDTAFISGEMEPKEIGEFSMTLPEYKEFASELRVMAKRIAQKITGNSYAMQKLTSTPYGLDYRRSKDLFMLVNSLISAYATKEYSMRETRLNELYTYSMQSVIMAIMEHVTDVYGLNPYFVAEMTKVFHHINNIFNHNIIGNFLMIYTPAVVAIGGLESDHLLPLIKGNDVETTDILHEEVDHLTRYKKIRNTRHDLGDFEIEIDNSENENIQYRVDAITYVNIYNKRMGMVCQAFISRSTGDLYVLTTDVCLDQIMEADLYKLLKVEIYEFIYDQLIDVEDDFESYVNIETSSEEVSVENISEEVNEEVRTVVEEADSEEISSTEEKSKAEKRAEWDKYRGVSCKETIKILSDILEQKPKNIGGDHKQFSGRPLHDMEGNPILNKKGEHVTRKGTVPDHGKSSLGTRKLRLILKRLGIPMEEFVSHL